MVSIIIPVLNEEKNVELLLKNIANLEGNKEIIIVDGGSSDKTAEKASLYGKVISSPKGRGKQMNAGAKVAKGDILWFLHLDSKVDLSSILEINTFIEKGYIGGGFSIYFHDYNNFFMKYISYTSNIRARSFGVYYGDQGIFVRKDVFEKVGGYPNIPLMEDIEFSLKIKKEGKMILSKVPIGTSGRKFKKGGPLRTHLLMHKIRILYMLGVSTDKLYNIYYFKKK